jgi:two-component system, chemotaxis family, CheB/CheR fusion protein
MESDPSGSGRIEIQRAPGDTTPADPVALDHGEILDAIDVAIVVLDRAFGIARFNRPAAEALNLDNADIGRPARELSGLADLRNLERWCAYVISTETTSRHDFRKNEQTFVLRIAPYLKDNRISGTVLTFTNVTAFRASIDQAIYEREYTKAILNAGADPLVVLSQDLRLQTANRAFHQMFGVPREAMQSISLDSLADGTFDLARVRAQLQKLIADGGEFQAFELEHGFQDARPRTFVIDARPLSFSGNSEPMILLSFHDVTMRKQAEAAHARLSAIVQSSNDAILSQDLNGIITSWNQGAERIFGYKSAETIGKPITILVPADRADEEPSILECVRRGDRINDYETVRLRQDGSLVDISLTVSPIIDEHGANSGASKIARDITQRKRAEEALRAADRAKDEFLAMLGHELRNPLAALASAVQILDLPEPSPNHLPRARAIIDRQIERLSHLVDDLVDASRLTSAKMRLSRGPLDFSRVVKETTEVLRTRGLLDRHQLTLDGSQVWIDADETRIEQIVTNLIGNALKFTPPGGTITISVRGAGERALLEVKDTGMGISADILPTIFDLFVQSERNIERSQGGLGIGLSLVRGLVELHGGTVHAASDGAGMGSTFTVNLPAIPAPNANARDQILIIPAECKPRRVLVVEDNDDIRETLDILLTEDGHEVYLANDGPSGLQAALTFRPDIGLLDLGLPGFDGYELARRIRAHDACKTIYLVALTGYGQPQDRLRSKEAGFDELVVKPLEVSQLALLLQRGHR